MTMSTLAVSPGDRNSLDYSPLDGTSLSFLRYQRLRGRARSTMAYIGVESPILVEYQAFNKFSELGFDLVPERDNKSKYEPQKLISALARYGKKPDLSKVDRRVLKMAKDLTLREFGGDGSLAPLPLDFSLEEFIKPGKSAGMPTFVSKGDAFFVDLDRAKRIADGTRSPDPCVAYHRVQHGDEGPKTRLVWGYPLSMFILESRFAPLLIRQFLRSDSSMAFGLVKSQVSARMLQVSNAAYRYCLDFSGFDTSIAAEFIDFAFGVLKTHFRRFTPEEMNTWKKLITYFIHTPVLMPNASVWQKHHGVPSGSYFTQMIDSIVNYLAITYTWLRLTGSAVPSRRVLVLGDDAVVGQSIFFGLSHLVGKFEELGLTLNARKTQLTKPGEPVHFLGHTWFGGVADRPLRDVVLRITFPETPSGDKDARSRYYTRILALGMDSLSGSRLVNELAPSRSNDMAVRHASYRRGLRRDRLASKDRTGYQRFLEDEGLIDPVSKSSLTSVAQDLGLWLS